ncbi:amidohydrolase family protein [Roseomonas marmotae]|uniref:Amidohydrolase family protein n=1 Tax=Roseomonas marmotae TaxID=2768161 RepID=A0ABS3KJX5_9PROT|nr:amidohydrolase family protein [Roseomonas marmotae]MBO1077270.1 amidohydrolase family protein [Roseomonas marmotae]QTI81064.1 amidohydrolase family protein [Roseomonas marmotae]
MDLLITDTVVLTCDDERRVIEHGAIAVQGNRIMAVGNTADLERDYPGLERFSARGLAVLPGFINAHTHTALTVLRGTVEDWDGNAVYGYMSPVSYEMSAEERAIMVQLGCLEAIRSGCATLVDPWRHLTSYVPAMAATGLRLWVSENCADINTLKIRAGDYSEDRAFGQVFLDRTIEGIEAYHGMNNDRVRCQIAAHAPDNCTPWMLDQLMQLSRKHGLTRTVHLAQSLDELDAVKAAYGLTPAEYLDREGFLGPDLVGAHWSYCTPSDVELLASRGTQMVHCPANSSRRGPHVAPVGLIRDAGINVAIGTDNMTEDMFHALKIGLILHRGGRGLEKEGGVNPQPQALLDGITRNAARSVGAEAEIGTIEVGKKADLTFLDLNMPSMRPIIRLVSNIVHYGHPGIVHSVMTDGTFLMRDRKVLALDESSLLQEAQAVTERVWKRMMAKNPDIAAPPGGLQWIDA